jgi:pSer/pThr/pTyr-binding forkhead associated (FHA) protein
MSQRDTLDGPRPPGAAWSLVGAEGDHPLVPAASIRIGRGLDCDVVLDHPSVSRHHATISFEGARPRIEDAMSRHGTMVNGQRTEGVTPLKHGDRVALGGAVLILRDLRHQGRAERDTLQVPALTAAQARLALTDAPVTGEHDPVSAMLAEIQLLVDASEPSRASSLIVGLLRAWTAQTGSRAVDEGTLRRGSTAILRAVGPALWIDQIVSLHQRNSVLIHASTLDQLEAATRRSPRIDWEALATYAQWLRTSGVAQARGEYGEYCVKRLERILRARP